MSRGKSANIEPRSERGPLRGLPITIDDLLRLARQLVTGLEKMGEYKHPLAIRRGFRKGVRKIKNERDRESVTIKAGSRTYFLDIDTTSEGKPYLRITESRLVGKDKERERNSIIVFQENAEEFAEAISEIAVKIA